MESFQFLVPDNNPASRLFIWPKPKADTTRFKLTPVLYFLTPNEPNLTRLKLPPYNLIEMPWKIPRCGYTEPFPLSPIQFRTAQCLVMDPSLGNHGALAKISPPHPTPDADYPTPLGNNLNCSQKSTDNHCSS